MNLQKKIIARERNGRHLALGATVKKPDIAKTN